MNITEFEKWLIDRWHYVLPSRRVVCNDGFEISIQYGRFGIRSDYEMNDEPIRYLEYNRFNELDKLTSIKSCECGFPSFSEPLLEPYHSEANIYNFVPLNVIFKIINKHRGVNVDKSGVESSSEYWQKCYEENKRKIDELRELNNE